MKRQVDGPELLGEPLGLRSWIGHATRVPARESIVNPDGFRGGIRVARQILVVGSRRRHHTLNAAVGETVSLLALLAVLAWAVIRPRGWPEAVAAAPAAVILIAAGAIPADDAGAAARRLGPVIGFLIAILVLARLCDDDGLFRACGAWLARSSAGRPRRLLALVFVTSAVTTAVLSLDTTVVLLTPVVFATAARLEVRSRPHVYACTHLANSASLLLPVSNLTNLLAFAASGLAFGRFAALMALPWLAVIGTEYAVFGRFFASDLGAAPRAPRDSGAERAPLPVFTVPVFTVVVVALTLAGFVVASAAGVSPAWAALAGAAVLAGRALARRRVTPLSLLRAADLPFGLFVLGLGIVVQAVVGNGLGRALAPLLPSGTSLPALLAVAALAAALANVCNNLPAVLVLLPLTAASGSGAVLAVLLGVNIGPNLTYTGSLATLLWRRTLRHHGSAPDLGEFTRLGLLTVPAGLVIAVLALWVGLRALGG
jgi:arsenical pump membrane protein